MQSVREFWAEVKGNKLEIAAAVAQSTEQPKNKTVYIVSLRNKDRNTDAGSVVEASVEMAAQRMAEGTHVLANDDQIVEHNMEQEQRRIDAQNLERKQKRSFVTAIDDSGAIVGSSKK